MLVRMTVHISNDYGLIKGLSKNDQNAYVLRMVLAFAYLLTH